MTEEEWLQGRYSSVVLESLKSTQPFTLCTERKLGLFGCACCRSIWDLLLETTRKPIEQTEAYLDGETTADEWRSICNDAKTTFYTNLVSLISQLSFDDPRLVAIHAARCCFQLNEGGAAENTLVTRPK